MFGKFLMKTLISLYMMAYPVGGLIREERRSSREESKEKHHVTGLARGFRSDIRGQLPHISID